MDDLLDRLAVLSPPAYRDLDVEALRTRVGRRRRRRTAVVGVLGTAAVLAGVVGVRLAADDDAAPSRVDTVDQPASVPLEWGGPMHLVGEGDDVFVVFEGLPGPGVTVGGGIARLDPVSGDLTPVTDIDPSSSVGYGAGSLWVTDPSEWGVDRLDPRTGEHQDRITLRPLADVPEVHWVVVAGDERGIWLVSSYDGGDLVHVDAETGQERVLTRVGALTGAPVLGADGDLWVAQESGLHRVSTDGEVREYTGPETGGRILDLAWDGDRLWLIATPRGRPAQVGAVDPGGPLDAALDTIQVPAASAIAAAEDRICVDTPPSSSPGVLACRPDTDGRLMFDTRGVVANDEALGDSLVTIGDVLWGLRWGTGQVVRVDPNTAAIEVVADLPFDGEAAISAQMSEQERVSAPIGPVRHVVEDQPLPDGGGTWSFDAWEALAGVCGRFLGTGEDEMPDCGGVPEGEVLSGGYTDGRFSPFFARFFVSPEVRLVRFELRDGEDIEVVPTAITPEVGVVAAAVPDRDAVARTVFLDAAGRVLDETGPSFGVPDD